MFRRHDQANTHVAPAQDRRFEGEAGPPLFFRRLRQRDATSGSEARTGA